MFVMSKHEQAKTQSIRLPAELRAFLLEQARINQRSLSGEIVYRLRQTRREQERAA